MTYDLLIIGAGPAGLTAAIYAVRYSLNTLVLAELVGGLLNEAKKIENYPGFITIDGIELARKIEEQAKALGTDIRTETVKSVKKESGTKSSFSFRVESGRKVYLAKAVLFASGSEHRKLDVPGEAELLGKGVSYCVLCDGAFFKDKVVVVVGGGDGAVQGASEVAQYAKKVYLIHRREEFKAKPDFVEQAKKHPKIEFILNTNVIEILAAVPGEEKSGASDQVRAIRLDQPYQGSGILKVDGIFIQIGLAPSTKLASDLGIEVNEQGLIVVKQDQSTNFEGVFAAGDITTGSDGMRQIVTAAAEGAIAAQSIYKYLQNASK